MIIIYQTPGTPPVVLESIAQTECGRFGLKFASSPKARVLSIVDSYNNGYVKKGGPVLYVNQKMDTLKLKQPGWHRLQIIFEGKSRIICAIDGQVLGFSPIEEGTLKNLRAGIIVIPPENSEESWKKSHAGKKPLLIFFYAPRVKIYQDIIPILETDSQALKLLSQYLSSFLSRG
jgi:hypothetical protein